MIVSNCVCYYLYVIKQRFLAIDNREFLRVNQQDLHDYLRFIQLMQICFCLKIIVFICSLSLKFDNILATMCFKAVYMEDS